MSTKQTDIPIDKLTINNIATQLLPRWKYKTPETTTRKNVNKGGENNKKP